MAADDETAEWFGGVPGRDETEATFLEQLRREASSWDQQDVTPALTSSLYIGLPLYAGIDVPGLTQPACQLQLAFWTGGHWAGRSGGYVCRMRGGMTTSSTTTTATTRSAPGRPHRDK